MQVQHSSEYMVTIYKSFRFPSSSLLKVERYFHIASCLTAAVSNSVMTTTLPATSSSIISSDREEDCECARRIMYRGLAPLNILYEDTHCIAVNKPSPMLSVPGKSKEDEIHPKRPRFEQFMNAVVAAMNTPSCDMEVKKYLKGVVESGSCPRKFHVFKRFVSRNLGLNDAELQERCWKSINAMDEVLNKQKVAELPLEMVSATQIVQQHLKHRIYNVHRLDMDTSGILLLAKSDQACTAIGNQFSGRQVQRISIASPSDHYRKASLICPS